MAVIIMQRYRLFMNAKAKCRKKVQKLFSFDNIMEFQECRNCNLLQALYFKYKLFQFTLQI